MDEVTETELPTFWVNVVNYTDRQGQRRHVYSGGVYDGRAAAEADAPNVLRVWNHTDWRLNVTVSTLEYAPIPF